VRDTRADPPLRLLALALPPWFERRVITISPGEALEAGGSEWRDEIVSVEAGALDIVSVDGSVLHLDRGAVLWLDGVANVHLCGAGDEPTVLAAIRRRRMDVESRPPSDVSGCEGSQP
jgi:hypothetical protein